MLGSYVSPLAPTVILLLGAFILPVVMPRLPAHRQARQKIRRFSAPGLVGLALLSLLVIRLTYGADASGEGLELLSGWNFSTIESVAALMVRADNLSLPFLIVVLLLLLCVMLLHSTFAVGVISQRDWIQISTWLVLGAGACFLFVSANGLTLVYATMAFDTFIALYWWGRGYRDLGVARLFLGVLTAAGVILATLLSTTAPVPGLLLLGLALWLRLGLYPVVEEAAHVHWRNEERLIYLGLTLAVGIYLTIRMIHAPPLALVRWLVVITMLLGGLMAWLTDTSAQAVKGRRVSLLVWLILTESLLILLTGPPDIGPAIAFAVGLILSLVALWVTPALGRPRLSERAWSWPYLPAVAATLTLVGLPFSLGWPARLAIYQSLNHSAGLFFMLLVILAESLALSGLVRYWIILVQGGEVSRQHSVVGIIAMTPFLIPALATFILSGITDTNLTPESMSPVSSVWVVITILMIGAVALAYFRGQIITWLNLPVETVIDLLRLQWFLRGWESILDKIGKLVLRVRVTVEGQHYMGWAIFVALVGALIILLST